MFTKPPNLVLLLLAFCANLSYACKDLKVPVEVVTEDYSVASESSYTERVVIVPLEYNNWTLSGATFNKGKNRIRIARYLDEDEYPEQSAFYVYGDQDFFEGSYVTVIYAPPKGGEWSMPCLHSQRVDWET